MKHSAVQLAKQIINDNRDYIEGNIADYMTREIDMHESDIFLYLSDEEIEEIESNPDKYKDFAAEVNAMLRANFDYDIEEFQYY